MCTKQRLGSEGELHARRLAGSDLRALRDGLTLGRRARHAVTACGELHRAGGGRAERLSVDAHVAPPAVGRDHQLAGAAGCDLLCGRLRGKAGAGDRAELVEADLELLRLAEVAGELVGLAHVRRSAHDERVRVAGRGLEAREGHLLAVEERGRVARRAHDLHVDRAFLQGEIARDRGAAGELDLVRLARVSLHADLHVDLPDGEVLDRRGGDLGADLSVDPDVCAGRIAVHDERRLLGTRERVLRGSLCGGRCYVGLPHREDHAGRGDHRERDRDQRPLRALGGRRHAAGGDRARARRDVLRGEAARVRARVRPLGVDDLLRDDLGELAALHEGLLLRSELLLEEHLHELRDGDAAHGELRVTDEGLEIRLHLAGALVALLAVLLEGAHHDRLEAGRISGRDPRGVRVVALDDELERLVLGRALEQALARRELEEHDAEREDVAPRVDVFAASLLGRHVRDLALELPALRALGRLRAALRDAEVDDLHVAREADDDVLRADVAVDDVEVRTVEVATLVRVGEACAHPQDDGDRVLDRELHHAALLHLPDDRPQVFAVDVLERDEVCTVDLADVDRLDDVRVRERRGDTRFVEQHVDEPAILVHRRQDALDDDELLEPGDRALEREVDLRHAARRHAAQQRVFPEPTRKDLFGRSGRF